MLVWLGRTTWSRDNPTNPFSMSGRFSQGKAKTFHTKRIYRWTGVNKFLWDCSLPVQCLPWPLLLLALTWQLQFKSRSLFGRLEQVAQLFNFVQTYLPCLIRGLTGCAVPALPACDCPLLHQRRKSSYQWRGGWTGFDPVIFYHDNETYFVTFVTLWRLLLLGAGVANGHLSCSAEPSWSSSRPTRA